MTLLQRIPWVTVWIRASPTVYLSVQFVVTWNLMIWRCMHSAVYHAAWIYRYCKCSICSDFPAYSAMHVFASVYFDWQCSFNLMQNWPIVTSDNFNKIFFSAQFMAEIYLQAAVLDNRTITSHRSSSTSALFPKPSENADVSATTRLEWWILVRKVQ